MPKRTRDTTGSNTYRFFVDPGAIHGDRVHLADPELAHQIGGVLRLGPGDHIVLLDGLGAQYVVLLEQVDRRGTVAGAVERRESALEIEPRTQITLYLPLIRPERFEWALQKGVELGATAFVPTLCAHSISEGGPPAKKLERWRKILREAAEQSRRGRLPLLEQPCTFAEACARASGTTALLLWEGAGIPSLRDILRRSLADKRPTSNEQRLDLDPQDSRLITQHSFSLLSGPEGGLSDHERQTAADHGIISVSLGPRTLRAETAPIVAAAAVLYEMGDLS
ncbi:MAG: hypothetical protein RLZZ387_2322 [Chloroflexota bacterium]|jgi:16S rRNA (uracil1498-N3)-methyltransferase